MQIFLRNTRTGQFLRAPGQWTDRLEDALNFETMRQATNHAFEMGFKDVELFFPSDQRLSRDADRIGGSH